jgi:opacity protein-like surface antigen
MPRALLLGTVALVASAVAVHAADLRSTILGGPPPAPAQYKPKIEYDWGGLYGGVHAGSAMADHRVTTGPVSAGLLSRTEFAAEVVANTVPAKSSLSDQAMQFGGFLGRNWTEGDLVFGFELDYTSFGDMKATNRSTARGLRTEVELTGVVERIVDTSNTNGFHYKDALIAKARFGQSFDRFLPYGFLGAGVVRVDHFSSGTARGVVVDALTNATLRGPLSEAGQRRFDRLVMTYAAGLGLDYAVADNIILRGEYTFYGLTEMNGAKGYINAFRGGVAAKF